MEAINPFADPEFKKQIIGNNGGSTDDYELITPDYSASSDLQNIISGAPSIPKSKEIKNVILDASALAKNDKEAKAQEISAALNKIFTDYNREYKTDLQIDFGNLSRTLVNVSDPKKRRVLELYLSEVYKSIKPVLILHMIQKLQLAIDYVLDPARLFDSNSLSTADIFIIIEKMMGYIDALNNMQGQVSIEGSDLELRKLADENSGVSVMDSPENRQAYEDFMKLLRADSGIKSSETG